jgi:serine/threonine-protein kinase HipA
LHGIEARHWYTLATKHGGPPVWQAMQALVARVSGAIDVVRPRLPRGFPARTWERITEGLRAQVRRFEAGAAALQEPTP